MRYVPLVTGALLGIAQFLPEVSRGRLRLAMHLPIPLGALMVGHLSTAYDAYEQAMPGLVLLTVLIAPAALLAAARFRDGAVS
ncbi:hypothetical protein CKO25_14640 [Thiocapsa imhoffii]|uniref:Uncharacterized protein n=1 Tax=Thiocapsa imhoffii TaxID=382777 RepID=A0A9X0WJV9_9GAMM|nr:hypothetical protein [Thiocapsa imhoffii]MBK1645866.1 hypothetical protein [Thiocapsa imhoffii]